MKREYQYLIAGMLVSAAVLMGMGNTGEEKQTTEGRYQYIENSGLSSRLYSTPTSGSSDTVTNDNLFFVIDSQTGTVNYVDVSGQTIVFPFATTKAN